MIDNVQVIAIPGTLMIDNVRVIAMPFFFVVFPLLTLVLCIVQLLLSVRRKPQ